MYENDGYIRVAAVQEVEGAPLAGTFSWHCMLKSDFLSIFSPTDSSTPYVSVLK